MASRASVELRFSQLAKDAVTVTRDIDTTRLTRVLELGEFDSPTVEVDFAFAMVGERPQVSVTHDFAMKRDCQWCLEPKATVVELRAATMLAVSEEQASAWQLEDDAAYIVGKYQEAIAVANPNSFDEVAWLEDELLAAWPSQVCADEACAKRPSTNYAASGNADIGADEAPEQANPFAVLEQLKTNSDSNKAE